jgi:transposase
MTSALYLNAGEVEQLTEVFRTTDDRRLRDRAQAVLMASHGRTTAQIAEDMAVHISTIRRWLAHWRRGGLRALKIQWAPGKRPLIDAPLAATVVDWVRQGPVASGMDRANWTSAALAEHLAQTHGVRVAERTMRDFCRRHGIRPYRPTYRFLRADADKQEQARRELSVLKKRRSSRQMRAARPG